MISSTPKKHQDSPKFKSRDKVRVSPSKLTISIILGYASALRVYKTKAVGFTNVLIN